MIIPEKLKLKMISEVGDRPENLTDDQWEVMTSIHNSISDIVNGPDVNAKINLLVSGITGVFEISDEEDQEVDIVSQIDLILEELLSGGGGE